MATSNIKNQVSCTPLLISALMCIALTGCNPGERREAKVLAKATEDASSGFEDYEASVLDDYQRLIVTRNLLNHAPYEPEQRLDNAKKIQELQARSALAKQLHTMATAASGVLNFSADDAKKAARDLASKIATVNNHSFVLPPEVTRFLPADKQDPNDYLDDAVKSLVQVQALRSYREALPKIRTAIVDVELFFEADRYAQSTYTAERVSNDFRVVEEAQAIGVTLDVSFLQPSFEPFNIVYKPSPFVVPVANAGAGNTLPDGVTVAIGETLHSLLQDRIRENTKVANDLFSVEMDLDDATPKHDFAYLHFVPGDFANDAEIAAILKAAKEHKYADNERPSEEFVIGKAIVGRMSADDYKTLTAGKGTSDWRRKVLCDAANSVVTSPALFPIPVSTFDADHLLKPDPTTPLVPDEVLKATRFVQYTGPERNVDDHTTTRQYFIPLPPAGNVLAGIHYNLIKNDILKGALGNGN